MNKISPTLPSYVFGYWRPWKENSNAFESYLDYARDTSLARYGADTIGVYISQASKEQVQAINDVGQAIGQVGQTIGRGLNILSIEMERISKSLHFLNRNLDIQIEQQKLSNLLLQNIAELLRVPDSEKERQLCIELGIKFFVNASRDADLYSDALEEFLKAESLRKQDYFVLHRIGCIYLYIDKHINPERALDYFLRAAKYASVESDVNAIRLVNVLANKFDSDNTDVVISESEIGHLAADSFEKAAFAAYVLGRYEDAVNYQQKALRLQTSPKGLFLLAKYQIRIGAITSGIASLKQAIEVDRELILAVLLELDLLNEPEVIKLVAEENDRSIIKSRELERCLENNNDPFIKKLRDRIVLGINSTLNERLFMVDNDYELLSDGLVGLIGASVESTLFKEFLSYYSNPHFNGEYYLLYDSGLRVGVENDVVRAIVVFSGLYDSDFPDENLICYKGKIPLGLNISDHLEEIKKKIGAPDEWFSDISAYWSSLGICIVFNDAGLIVRFVFTKPY